MAEETFTKIVDDLDKQTPASRYVVSINDDHTQLDLSDENFERMCADLAPWLAHGKKIRLPHRRRTGPAPAVVRKWALQNNYEIKPGGRIPDEILKAYKNRKRKG